MAPPYPPAGPHLSPPRMTKYLIAIPLTSGCRRQNGWEVPFCMRGVEGEVSNCIAKFKNLFRLSPMEVRLFRLTGTQQCVTLEPRRRKSTLPHRPNILVPAPQAFINFIHPFPFLYQ